MHDGMDFLGFDPKFSRCSGRDLSAEMSRPMPFIPSAQKVNGIISTIELGS